MILVSGVAVVAPALLRRGGCLDHEGAVFIQRFADSSRGIAARIFDSTHTEWGVYQARELSYVIDFADAQIHTSLARAWDVAWFIPGSATVTSLLLVVVLFEGIRRTMPNVTPVMTALWAACLVTSPQFLSTMAVFYRSAKPALAVVVLAALFFAQAVHLGRAGSRRPKTPLTGAAIVAFAFAVIAPLLDREGVVYLAAAVVLIAWHRAATGAFQDLLAAVLAAVGVVLLYNLVAGPMLVAHFNGYWPDLAAPFRTGRMLTAGTVWRGLLVVIENAGMLLGGWPPVGWLIAAVAAVAAVPASRTPEGRRVILYAGFALAVHVVLFAGILHIATSAYPQRFWYYPLPLLSVLMFLGALVLNTLARTSTPRMHFVVMAGLALIIAGNLRVADRHTAVESGAIACEQTHVFRTALRDPAAAPQLDDTFRQFLDFHRGLRARRPD